MGAAFFDSNTIITAWPFGCSFVHEVTNGPKGVEGLLSMELAILKDAFFDSVDPLTYRKVIDPDKIKSKASLLL